MNSRKLNYVKMVHLPSETLAVDALIKQVVDKVTVESGHAPDWLPVLGEIRQAMITLASDYWPKLIEALEASGLLEGERARSLYLYSDGASDKWDSKTMREKFEITAEKHSGALAPLVVRFADLGATLVDTESRALLDANIAAFHDRASGKIGKEQLAQAAHARDEHVAKRINETLPQAAEGIIFMGAKHKVYEELAKVAPDIEVTFVRPNLEVPAILKEHMHIDL